jgi:predicted SprT family Zn-dependent metalloprotease
MTITAKTYADFEKAYDHFNKALFEDRLPAVLLTLVPHKSAYGYMRHEAFKTRVDPNKLATMTAKQMKSMKKPSTTHEIALNPFTFVARTDEEIMGTLVHEMVHLWQMMFGEKKPNPLKPTHNREWADKMKSLGLMPSSTGKPGGKETGRRMTHYITPGLFTKAAKLCKVEFDFAGMMIHREKKGSRRTKYTCPGCETNAYGTAELHLICGECNQRME